MWHKATLGEQEVPEETVAALELFFVASPSSAKGEYFHIDHHADILSSLPTLFLMRKPLAIDFLVSQGSNASSSCGVRSFFIHEVNRTARNMPGCR